MVLSRSTTLRGTTYRHRYDILQKPDDEFVDFLKDLGLLHQTRICRKCGETNKVPELKQTRMTLIYLRHHDIFEARENMSEN